MNFYTIEELILKKERLHFLLRNSYKKAKFTSHSASLVSGGVPFALQNRLSDNMYYWGGLYIYFVERGSDSKFLYRLS